MQFISYLINGISLGSVYAIIALGYTMVYGIAKMLNFAHGDIIMVGSYVVYIAVSSLGLNPILSVVISALSALFWGLSLKGGLQASETCIQTGRIDYCHWCQLFSSECSTADIWCQYEVLYIRCTGGFSETGISDNHS